MDIKEGLFSSRNWIRLEASGRLDLANYFSLIWTVPEELPVSSLFRQLAGHRNMYLKKQDTLVIRSQ
jgi:hypothetical protein